MTYVKTSKVGGVPILKSSLVVLVEETIYLHCLFMQCSLQPMDRNTDRLRFIVPLQIFLSFFLALRIVGGDCEAL